MRLAKRHLDIGTATDDWEASERFWRDDVGLAYEEFLKIGAGVRQHRFGCQGSVVKVNHSREALADHPTIHRLLRIASPRAGAPVRTRTPDGTDVELVPPGHDGVDTIEIVNATADPAAARRFWVDALGGDEVEPGRYRVGDTLVRCVPEPGLAPMTTRAGRGWRYLTVQVFDVDAEHARAVGLGFAEELAPVTLGTTARISFVRGHDGLFLEISQRANLTGPLPG
jgi:hypothetical protein